MVQSSDSLLAYLLHAYVSRIHCIASSVLKERSKALIQQKWDALYQKYRDVKNSITHTGEEPLQNEWDFFMILMNILNLIQVKQISEKENIIEEFQTLIKDQTTAIIEEIDRQHTRTMEI
ncbi:3587_t:CDS:2 [Gigaspora rosea]|nr:3587_t:CDS:2 [Gigaspora rosea]